MGRGRRPKRFTDFEWLNSPVWRLTPVDSKEGFTLTKVGHHRSVNDVVAPYINPNWEELEAQLSASISDEFRAQIKFIVQKFADETAMEKGGLLWTDKNGRGVMECAKRISEAANALLAAFQDYGPAPNFLIKRMQELDAANLKSNPFSYDELYPRLTSLNAHAHILVEELDAAKRRGDGWKCGNAWRGFVFGIAQIYWEMTGKEPMNSEIGGGNGDTQKVFSTFTKFAWAAMMQIPKELREPSREKIETFSGVVSDQLSVWKTVTGIKPKKTS